MKLDKSLFQLGNHNELREYKFIDLFGKHSSYLLRTHEKLLDKKCLMCDCHIVNGYDHMNRWTYSPCCPCCENRFYDIKELKSYMEDITKNIESGKKKLKQYTKYIEKNQIILHKLNQLKNDKIKRK